MKFIHSQQIHQRCFTIPVICPSDKMTNKALCKKFLINHILNFQLQNFAVTKTNL